MRMLMLGGIILLALLAVPAVSAQCSALTGQGWLPDTDCDTVPDGFDNCPMTANSLQEDRNRNAVGDACDVLIEFVTVEPDSRLRQGEFARIGINMINNRPGPVEDITVRVRSSSLDISQETTLDRIPLGEQANVEFWVKVPKCARTGSHDVTVTSSFREPATRDRTTEVQERTLTIERSDACDSPDGPLDNTIIEVLHETRIDRPGSTVIPVRITNFNDGQAVYHMSVDDLGSWGTWRIDPSPSVGLPAGKDATLYLYFETEEFTPPGTRTITLRVNAGEQQTVVPIDVYVRAPFQRAREMGTFLTELVLILAGLIVAGFILALAVLHLRNRHEKPRKKVSVEKAEDKERETYY